MPKDPENPAKMPHFQEPELVEPSVPSTELSRPVGVYVVAIVVGIEALAIGAMGLYSIFSALTQTPHSMASAVFLIVLLLALAAGLGAVAVNVFRGFRWTRSAAFVWQLLMVAIAVPALFAGTIGLGLLLLLPPVATVYFLFTPKVVAFSLRTGAENNVI